MSTLSQRCIYALRALMYTAIEGENRSYVSIREMADALDISFHFLTKTLQDLTRVGLLRSHRGPSGGVALNRPANEISILAIVEVIDGTGLFTDCLLGLEKCGERRPCPLHESWAVERERIRDMFANTYLSALSPKIMDETLRLSN